MRRKLLYWNNKENLEQGQKIWKQIEILEQEKSTVFYFIPKYLFFCPKGWYFVAFLSWMKITKISFLKDQAMKPHINLIYFNGPGSEFELTFIWILTSFPWCIWKSLSQFFSWWSILKILFSKSLPITRKLMGYIICA